MTSEIQPRGKRELWPFPGVGRMFEDWIPSHWPAQGGRVLHPAMDVEEDDEQIAITAELPGIEKEDVTITLEDGVLEISGEKRGETEKKGRNFHLVERTFGAFHRALTLPSSVDFEKAKATFKEGVLRIEMPKTEASKPHRLEIK